MFDAVFVTRYCDHRSFLLAQRSVARGLRGAGRLFAVVPDAELAAFARLPLQATVVPESRLDPRLPDIPGSWFKQQLIKLCLHRVMESPAALVLDSDTYLGRPVDAAWFCPDGRVPFYVEDRGGVQHPKWRAAAEATLRHASRKRWSYFPTPNFMHRDALADLHWYLGEQWGTDPVDGLLARLGYYTEWMTYGLFVDELLADDSPHRVCDADHVTGIWERAELDAWRPRADDPPLLVLQSTIRASWSETVQKLGRLPLLAACLEGGLLRA